MSTLHRQEAPAGDGALAELERRALFVVGNARSGTSITTFFFNRSPSVLLLQEANIYLHHAEPNFVDWFNQQHVGFGNWPTKGTYIPEHRTPVDGGLSYLLTMTPHHRLVGEKIAFGPHGKLADQTYQQAFFVFHGQFFYGSRYVALIRMPAEALWSMEKLFPAARPRELYETWLMTLSVCIDLVRVFPHVHVIFHEDLSTELLQRLAATMGIDDISAPADFISPKYQRSALHLKHPSSAVDKTADLQSRLVTLYESIRQHFPKETFRYDCDTVRGYYPDQFFDGVKKQIAELLAEVQADDRLK